jgi:hypothetical protein
MRKLIAIALSGLLMVLLSACSPESLNRYRYSCQDPQNWKLAECNPPECEASGLCTKDLLPKQLITDGTTVESSTNG